VGVSRQQLSYLARTGSLGRVAQGIYRLRRFPAQRFEDVIVACLWAGEGTVASHETALAVYELTDAMPTTIHVSVPRPFRGRRPGVTVHTAPLGDGERTERAGVPMTTVARTIADVLVRFGEGARQTGGRARSRTGAGDPRAATRRPRGPRRSWQGASRSHRGSLVTNGPPPCGSPAALRTVLARLVGVAPADSRARKGGQALRARLGTQARATKGADATWRASLDHFDDVLEAAVDSALGDGFTFEVAAPRRRTAETDEGGLRYRSSRCSRAGSSSGASSTSTRPRRPSPLDSVELRDLLASQASHLRTFR
jgi:hypothetical protein